MRELASRCFANIARQMVWQQLIIALLVLFTSCHGRPYQQFAFRVRMKAIDVRRRVVTPLALMRNMIVKRVQGSQYFGELFDYL